MVSVESDSFFVNIYGFSGKIGSGKDYVAKNVLPKILVASGKKKEGEQILYLAFADLLKSVCASRFGLKYDDLYGSKSSETRMRLQNVGDELRDKYGEMCFVNATKIDVAKHAHRSGIRTFVITDVRFPEEFIWIRKMGGVIFRVHSPERSKKILLTECKGDTKAYTRRASHHSETVLDCAKFDAVINNDFEENPAQGLSDWISNQA